MSDTTQDAAATTAPLSLTDYIHAEVLRRTSDEAVRAHIDKRIGEAVTQAIDQQMRSYGDVREQIEKAVGRALALPGEIDVPSYSAQVLAMLRAKMDEILVALINERLAAEMADILKVGKPEITLTEIIEEMRKRARRDDESHSHTGMTCHIRTSDYGFQYVSLDSKPDIEARRCTVQFGVTNEYKVFTLSVDQKDAKHTIVAGYMPSYVKMVFTAYACGSKIIIDDTVPDMSVWDE
ncbi:hypothetical protein SAMN02745172_02498 [Pseudoxanthobacter soli DSM 19599]|uniref:Uncharacterized protein n=1 Tax=Pseudoxanthobacter soli DSM 19599 TaxID=1123029 RepID=A0A1M7ZLU7_9HYPH|nr:hypothetical protein [Pseudoxanthobacter soli]SHO65851.1 hypothetical protein SAMN02745172_02498 [Pseudoxanthobacter soli DSM 19599]